MLTRPLLPLALLAGLALTGCQKDDDAAPADTALLAGRWLLARVDGEALAPGGTEPAYLEFVELGKCTVGLGPCNNFSGRFRVGGGPGQLRLTAPIPTREACPRQELETHYLANLAATARYEISGGELRLYDGTATTPRLVFRQAAR